jgi:glucose-6-phosphate 1-dehydrogenase
MNKNYIPDDDTIEEMIGEKLTDEKKKELERMRLANKTFEELTKDEKIQLALEELAAIVMGGQDGEEYYNSIKFIKDVLESFR